MEAQNTRCSASASVLGHSRRCGKSDSTLSSANAARAMIRKAAALLPCLLAAIPALAQGVPRPHGLPPAARVIERESLEASGHPDRALVLWMLKPKEVPSLDPYVYVCPDETRGSHYTGPTRVSLIDVRTNHVINTVKITAEYDENPKSNPDSFDIPYAIRGNLYYAVRDGTDGEGEREPHILFLKDYNGDGRALEFALFEKSACMPLRTSLIGYSERLDRVVHYPIELEVINGKKRTGRVSRWADYLFYQKPLVPGYWKYDIDYRGRGGCSRNVRGSVQCRRRKIPGEDDHSC